MSEIATTGSECDNPHPHDTCSVAYSSYLKLIPEDFYLDSTAKWVLQTHLVLTDSVCVCVRVCGKKPSAFSLAVSQME